jgi:hypothetical protein
MDAPCGQPQDGSDRHFAKLLRTRLHQPTRFGDSVESRSDTRETFRLLRPPQFRQNLEPASTGEAVAIELCPNEITDRAWRRGFSF